MKLKLELFFDGLLETFWGFLGRRSGSPGGLEGGVVFQNPDNKNIKTQISQARFIHQLTSRGTLLRGILADLVLIWS